MAYPVVIQGIDTTIAGRLTPDEGKLIKLAENFSKFLIDRQMKRPNVFRDLIKYGVFPYFQGDSQKTNIFRGTLGVTHGLSDWKKIQTTQKASVGSAGVDMCSYTPRTYDWSYETEDFEGFQTSWKSPTFCVLDLARVSYAQEQLGMIIKAGSTVTDDVRETFGREMYMKIASDAGRCVVLAEGALNFIDDSTYRFTFDPFEVDADGDQIIRFASALLPRISSLDWSFMNFIRTYLGEQCPGAAKGMESGMPVFPLMLDFTDFENMVNKNKDLREDFRYAKPQQLIEGFNMGFTVYRGFALSHDIRQARFVVKSNNGTTVIAKRVAPRRAVRAGLIGMVPEANPAYIHAELGTFIVFLSDVYEILVPPVLKTLGGGTSFSEGAPSFNGDWTWLNIQDPVHNPMKEFGHFFARFAYYAKPMEYATDAIVGLYRRCPQALGAGCAVEDADNVGSTDIGLAEDAVTADIDATNKTAILTLVKKLSVGLGAAVTVTDDAAVAVSAWVADASQAPTYKFVTAGTWSAYTAYTAAGAAKVSVV